jgi:hypothetical protein
VLAALGLLAILPKAGDAPEYGAFAYSLSVAFAVLVLSLSVLRIDRLGPSAAWWAVVYFVIKSVMTYAYHSLVYLRALGPLEAIPPSDLSGDYFSIQTAALQFDSRWVDAGLWDALFGDYYRAINNPGVGAVFGLLFRAFGAYPACAAPWNSLAMVWAGLAVFSICQMVGLDRRACIGAMLMTALMPAFILHLPIYRDQFMILLIVLMTYGVFAVWQRYSVVSGLVVIASSVLLASLREGFLMAPGWVLGALLLSRLLPRTRLVALAFPLAIAAAAPFLLSLFPEAIEHASLAPVGLPGALGQLLGSSGLFSSPGRTVYLLLTPMPWYQLPALGVLAYQVFDYPQTVLSLGLLAAAFLGFPESVRNRDRYALLLAALIFLEVAAVGSALHQRYYQVALPLLIVAASPAAIRQPLRCLGTALGIVGIAHVLLSMAKMQVA